MAIQFSTMTNWLSIFESRDNTRTHTLVSSTNLEKIYQKLYAGARFKKEICTFFIEVADAPVLNSPFIQKEVFTENTPLLLPFAYSEHWYTYASPQLNQYFSELHTVPVELISDITSVLNIVNVPDYHTLQMIDIELTSNLWKWHGLRDTAYPEVITFDRHEKLELQIFFMLMQMWLERLYKKGETQSTLVFLADIPLIEKIKESLAWKYFINRLSMLNIYLVMPFFEYQKLAPSQPPLVLESTLTGSTKLTTHSLGFE